MKKEIIAVIILVVLLVLAFINGNILEKKTVELAENVTKAEKIYNDGDTEGAKRLVKEALQAWIDWEEYTHIVLRHSEIELVVEGFQNLLGELEREERATPTDFERVRMMLDGIAKAEQLRWGSVL